MVLTQKTIHGVISNAAYFPSLRTQGEFSYFTVPPLHPWGILVLDQN